MKKTALIILGWTLLVLGVAGLFLPFLQGILLILAGLFILSRHYPWAHRLFAKLKERFPRLAEKFHKFWQNSRWNPSRND
jgi:uncharacterized membrane protein YbaN (DUF454 family)